MVECDFEKILPHRSPMILIDAVESVDFDAGELVARVDVKESDILFQADINGVPSWVALEYMAQAIGCFVGLFDMHNKTGSGAAVGFVLGSRCMNVHVPVLESGKSYFVRVSSQFNDANIASFDCVMYNDENQPVADAALNVFRPDNIQEFMREMHE